MAIERELSQRRVPPLASDFAAECPATSWVVPLMGCGR